MVLRVVVDQGEVDRLIESIENGTAPDTLDFSRMVARLEPVTVSNGPIS